MKPEVTLKYLSYLRNKKNQGEEGFTLIELLVVVIIIGVLAAVALPNLLNQVGKARETEGKNGIGSINRTQQTFHFERGRFSSSLSSASLAQTNELGIIVPLSKYYAFTVTTPSATTTLATANALTATGADDTANGQAQGIKEFAGSTVFAPASGAYGTVICTATVVGVAVTAATADTTNPIAAGQCAGGTDAIVK